jgi:hypothetical protein
MSESGDEEFDVGAWFSKIRLTVAATTKIRGSQIEDLDTLLLLRESDIDAIKLGLGDSIRLRAGISALQAKYNTIPLLKDEPNVIGSEKVPPVVKKVVDLTLDVPKYSQRQVEELLAGRAAVESGSGVTGVKASPSVFGSLSTDPAVACIRELMRDLLGVDGSATNAKGEKALLPINFLSCVRGTQDSEDVVHSAKGMNLVLQTNLRRVTPDKLTPGQWIAANSRILSKLIDEKKLSSVQIEQYLEYTRRIGDLLQIFTASSVFVLDNHHRLEQHQTGDSMSLINCTLQNSHLKKKDESVASLHYSAAAAAKSSAGNGGGSARRGAVRPCWMYNSDDGCPYGKSCRYDHVDGESRAQRFSNVEKAPRFQNKAIMPSSKGN